LTIKTLASFDKELKKLAKRYRNIKKDMKQLYQELLENQKSGVEIAENYYKIRLANSSIPTGKSGGFRAIYYYLDNENNIILLSIYSKTEQASISEDKIIQILKENGLERKK
jgi:mRNA-degrading endonuclease RelE of RelBE toxin-antitoxin system